MLTSVEGNVERQRQKGYRGPVFECVVLAKQTELVQVGLPSAESDFGSFANCKLRNLTQSIAKKIQHVPAHCLLMPVEGVYEEGKALLHQRK